jgi:YaiO family outer membrane protein
MFAPATTHPASAQQAPTRTPAAGSSVDVMTEARALSANGQRNEAIELLREYLTSRPTDIDARILYGATLSWEGRYDEAREQLNSVLAASPTNGDALTALINVELWSEHADRAEAIARGAIAVKGASASLLISQARALNALNRLSDAHGALKRALVIEPSNEQAIRLSQSLEERMRDWHASTSFGSDWFSDNRTPWHETQTSVSREKTPVGSMTFRFSHAARFGSNDNQVEVEMYPKLRPGMYAFVGIGVSPEQKLYPGYRAAFDVYQSLGHGFEGSAGFRRLGFTTPVNIYVATLSKYYGAWMFTGRSFFVPDQTEGSHSFHGSVRRYFGAGESYVGARYGRGFSREELYTLTDIVALDSNTVAGEASIALNRRWSGSVSASVSRQERAERDPLTQYSLGGGLSVRF